MLASTIVIFPLAVSGPLAILDCPSAVLGPLGALDHLSVASDRPSVVLDRPLVVSDRPLAVKRRGAEVLGLAEVVVGPEVKSELVAGRAVVELEAVSVES
jgi:hypothetical protein